MRRLRESLSSLALHGDRIGTTLALESGEYRIAEQLIGSALAGSPPEEIADELNGELKGATTRPTR